MKTRIVLLPKTIDWQNNVVYTASRDENAFSVLMESLDRTSDRQPKDAAKRLFKELSYLSTNWASFMLLDSTISDDILYIIYGVIIPYHIDEWKLPLVKMDDVPHDHPFMKSFMQLLRKV